MKGCIYLKTYLNPAIENQLNELLLNRPVEEKPIVRKRNKIKDYIKQIRTGDGYSIKRRIIDQSLGNYLNQHPITDISPKKVQIQLQKLEPLKIVKELDSHMCMADLNQQFTGYHCTQNTEFVYRGVHIGRQGLETHIYDKVVKLTAIKYRWFLQQVDNGQLLPVNQFSDGFIIESAHVDSNFDDEQLIPLNQFLELFRDHLSENDLSKMYDSFYEKANRTNYQNELNHLNQNPAKYLTLNERDVLQKISAGYYGPEFDYAKDITNRSEVKIYLDKQLRANDSFDKLHNRVETFLKEAY